MAVNKNKILGILICLLVAVPPALAQDTPTGQITAGLLNMRAGPGTGYDIIAELPYGTRVTLHGRSAGGAWLLVRADTQGWVSAYYVKTDPGVSLAALPITEAGGAAQAPTPAGTANSTFYTTVNLRLRSGPSEDHETLAVLAKNSAVTAGQTSAGGYWQHVTVPGGQSGWVSTCCLTDNPPGTPDEPAGSAPANEWPLNMDFVSVGARTREIYQAGQAVGRNPRAFSKFGDCNSMLPYFLAYFDQGRYNLGPYGYLQPVIDHFAGSFARDSLTVWGGSRTWMMFDPTWSNPQVCRPNETPIACEYRVHNPSMALVSFGTNEMGHTALFDENLRALVEYSISAGVVPILATKADQLEGAYDTNNEIIRTAAAEYGVPLWDWGKVAQELPNNGLGPDGVHLAWLSLNFRDSRVLYVGQPVHNLTALMALDAVWRSAAQ